MSLQSTPLVHGVRAGAMIVALLATACSMNEGPAYLHDRGARRAALETSLVNPSNDYSALRLERYATGAAGSWDDLPESNPLSRPVMEVEIEAGAHADPSFVGAPFELTEAAAEGDEAALLALGEDAFFRYPVQFVADLERALASRDAAAKYGLWLDGARGAGGIVRARLASGAGAFATTCATCHAATRDGVLVIGLGNERLDLGKLALDSGGVPSNVAANVASWGRGRLDVSSTNGSEPVRIPDLRSVRWLSHLHHDATIAQRDRTTLAIRIETLLITSHGDAVRPSRLIALALASYVESLADALDEAPANADAPAERLFGAHCAGCHGGPHLTGPPVPLDVVGTDPRLGQSSDRGTGMYRVPSLRGVSDRRLLLHDGSLSSLRAMFDPARTSPDFSGGVREGPIPGHVFGLDLDARERASLVSYLETL